MIDTSLKKGDLIKIYDKNIFKKNKSLTLKGIFKVFLVFGKETYGTYQAIIDNIEDKSKTFIFNESEEIFTKNSDCRSFIEKII